MGKGTVSEADTDVKMSGQRNILEEEEWFLGVGDARVTDISAFCLFSVSLSFPVCKMEASRLMTYIRTTGIQYFVKASKKPYGWQSTDNLITQTANSYV